MKKLTDKQRQILFFIQTFCATRGFPPTVREIGQHFGIASTNGVDAHLLSLEKKGYIYRDPGLSRAIVLKQMVEEK